MMPEVMLAPMCLSQPRAAFWFATISLASAMVGAVIGYYLGHYAYAGGEAAAGASWACWNRSSTASRWCVRRAPRIAVGGVLVAGARRLLADPDEGVHLGQRHRRGAVLPFMLSMLIGRGKRLYLVAAAIRIGGERAERALHKYIEPIGWSVLVLMAGAAVGSCCGAMRHDAVHAPASCPRRLHRRRPARQLRAQPRGARIRVVASSQRRQPGSCVATEIWCHRGRAARPERLSHRHREWPDRARPGAVERHPAALHDPSWTAPAPVSGCAGQCGCAAGDNAAEEARSIDHGPPRTPAPTPVVVPATSKHGWRWPADGNVVGTYAGGDPTRQGIDIAGKAGQPVRAAADGVVVYSGSGLVGYGELVIVKHDDQWLSAYGHNRARLVNEGQLVKAGQQIAEMGRSGASRDMLHFEIRYNGKPVDPQQYLPTR
jgi:membrane protein YqaA with SNARE-associated domain